MARPILTSSKAADTSKTLGIHTQLSREVIHMPNNLLPHNLPMEGDSNKEATMIGMGKDKRPAADMVSPIGYSRSVDQE